MMYPQLVFAYNEGPKELARLVAARMREWIVSSGYDRALAVNAKRTDPVFMRALSYFGEPSLFGSVIQFKF